MTVGSAIEPVAVVSLLFGGTLLNRNRDIRAFAGDYNPLHLSAFRRKASADGSASPRKLEEGQRRSEETGVGGLGSWTHHDGDRSSTSSLTIFDDEHEPTQRLRRIKIFGWKKTLTTPNTAVFKDRVTSRVLRKFPFLIECWYWAMIYWVRLTLKHWTSVITERTRN
jgi:hypothetical protein